MAAAKKQRGVGNNIWHTLDKIKKQNVGEKKNKTNCRQKKETVEKKSVCGIECHQAAAQNPNEWQPKCWRLKSFLAMSCDFPPSHSLLVVVVRLWQLPAVVKESGNCAR